MSLLDDTAIFIAVVQQGGFSHAAKRLGVSNGLISRRISQLETKLGVTLIKRTTRQLQLTTEGELFWQHAERIQAEFDSAIGLIQSTAKKPKGVIRITAPPYFGRHFLTPLLMKFLKSFNDIKIDLILDQEQLDPIKEQLDLLIRGAGYLKDITLKDSSMQMKLLVQEKIGLYASTNFLNKYGEPQTPEALSKYRTINFLNSKGIPNKEKWSYLYKNKNRNIELKANFNCNDIESALMACIAGFGIGRFTELNIKAALQKRLVRQVLSQYDWGHYNLYAIYAQQQVLPQRTRLLLEFIQAHLSSLFAKT